MQPAPHPDSRLRTSAGHAIELKIHQCVWSGAHPPNSLTAIVDCYQAPVRRAEIDIAMLADSDFLVIHDLDLANTTDGHGAPEDTTRADARRLKLRHRGELGAEGPPLLADVVDAIRAQAYPTLLELDIKDWKPWPWRRVEQLARMLEPVKDRVTFGGEWVWNLRRLHVIDPAFNVGATLPDYKQWQTSPELLPDRLQRLLDLVPAARELHVHLEDALAMRRDGLSDLPKRLHDRGMLLDLWTINAGTPNWRERLDAAIDIGPDIITTETARELVSARG